MASTVPINKVEKDASRTIVKNVYNPLKQDFIFKFDGEELTIPAGKSEPFPENIAIHMARHLAKQIVRTISGEEREELLKKLEPSKRIVADQKPFPLFNKRVGNLAKILVKDVRDDAKVEKAEILEMASVETARGQKTGKKVKVELEDDVVDEEKPKTTKKN